MRGSRQGAAAGRTLLNGNAALLVTLGALYLGVNFLPPDTTLAQVRDSGVLRVCVPPTYPPLVTGEAVQPGIDIELLDAVAERLGVRVVPVPVATMGSSFNPRSWRLTRAQCLVLAGGIVDSPTTRSFLVVTRPHLEDGWAGVYLDPAPDSLDGRRVAAFAGGSNLDRLALSGWLRDQGAQVTVVTSLAGARTELAAGTVDVVVSNGFASRRLADDLEGTAAWLPISDSRLPIAFGLWKGDLSLERAIDRELARLHRSGFVAELVGRYELGAIDEACPFCR